ncbi:hypothetical protein [Paraburkholderia sp. CI3]|uniref:hypothetical protein n=1 Tax=Paraburkholderia sp. CI3 TaxID=2991060 RepID=UPI003D254E1F
MQALLLRTAVIDRAGDRQAIRAVIETPRAVGEIDPQTEGRARCRSCEFDRAQTSKHRQQAADAPVHIGLGDEIQIPSGIVAGIAVDDGRRERSVDLRHMIDATQRHPQHEPALPRLREWARPCDVV